jgi:hypothetical protein
VGRRGIILAALLATACIPKVDAPERPARAKADKPRETTLQCHADLRREGVEFRALPDRTYVGGCSALGAVQLKEIGTPITNLGAMTCPLARSFARWTREAVQPAAQQWLGAPLVRIESYGTYSCRPVNNKIGGRLSEHGLANAVDIAAFVVEGGRRVTVQEGWNGEDERVRRFLRAVHQAGCRRFAVGLGPEANALHHDHFHFDLGRGPYCK